MIKNIHLFGLLLLFTVVAACGKRSPCDGFVTAKDLDETDLTKCKITDDFKYMQRFSLAYNNYRRANGIPLLPAGFLGITWTIPNQVRWMNQKAREENIADSARRRPYLERKDLEWKGDQLIYDRSNYYSMDSLESWLVIEYVLDTLSDKNRYQLHFTYSNKYNRDDKHLILSSRQADSVLTAWHLTKHDL